MRGCDIYIFRELKALVLRFVAERKRVACDFGRAAAERRYDSYKK